MSDDLARLGIQWVPEGAEESNAALDKTSRVAPKAEKATDAFAASQRRAATATQLFQRTVRFAALDMSRQFADVGVSLAMGINPLMVLIQQGPQIADAMQMAGAGGASFSEVMKGMLVQIGLLRVVTPAAAAANDDLAVSAAAAATATAGLGAASSAAAVEAQAATVAAGELAAANVAVAETATAAAAAEAVALAPIAVVLGIIAAVIGTVAAGFGLLHRELSKGYPKDITNGLGLTEAQLDRVKHKTVTFGDTVMATFTVIGRHIMAGPVGAGLHWLHQQFESVMDGITGFAFKATVNVTAFFIATFKTIQQHWRQFPEVIGSAVAGAVNATIGKLEELINRAIGGLNELADRANKIPGVNLGHLGSVSIGRVAQPAMPQGIGADFHANFAAAQESVAAGLHAFAKEIQDEAIKRARDRAIKEAGKAGKHAGTRDATDERQAQIDQMIAQAKGDELQAQLAITKDLRARADLEKQIIDQQLAAKGAQIDKMEAAIADDKGLDDARKTALTAQLEAVRLTQEHTASLQKQKVDDDTAEALRQQEMDRLKEQADLQQRILNAQLGMATTYADRAAIEQRIFDAKQAQEKLEFEYTEALKLRNQQITPEQDAANRRDFATAQAGEASAFGRNQYLDAHPIQKWLEEVGDATDRSRQRGDLMVRTMDNFAESMAAAAVNAQDLGDTAKSVFRQMVQDLLASALKQGEASLIQAGASAFLHFLPGFATGTNYAPGGMAIVGERGPEVVNLPRGSQVIPNDALRGSNDNGRSPIVFDMRGAVVTEDLLRQMSQIAANGDAQVAQYADDRARQHAAAAGAKAAKDAIRAMPGAQRSYAKLGTGR